MKKSMIDISSNNGSFDVKAYWNAGYRVLGLKRTESTNYVWSEGAKYGDEFHKKGGIVVWYTFLHKGSGAQEAEYFWKEVKPHYKKTDILVLDAEISGVNGSECRDFIDKIHSLAGKPVRGMIYGSPGFLTPAGIKKYKGWKLWLAQYASHADVPPSWKKWTIWQYSNTHTGVPGTHGEVDIDRIRRWVFEPTLTKGDRNIAVLHLKHLLKEAGYKGFAHNQKFGNGTARAVKKFKKDHHLKQNSIAGPKVWKKLHR